MEVRLVMLGYKLFILGHIILYPICVVAVSPAVNNPGDLPSLLLGAAFLFIPLEIVYWVPNYLFVPYPD